MHRGSNGFFPYAKAKNKFRSFFAHGFKMTKKPTYEELEQRIKELEKDHAGQKTGNKFQIPEDKFATIIKHTNDLIAMTNFSLNPVYTFISPSHKPVMGYEPHELLGKSGFQTIHPGDQKKLLPLLKKYIGMRAKKLHRKEGMDRTEMIEYRAKDKSGKWHYLQSTVNIVGDELLFVSKDISERKAAEKKIRNSEELFRVLTENAPIGIYQNDLYGRFLYGNKKAEEITGYKREELIGKNFLKLKLLPLKDITRAVKYLALNRMGRATGPDQFTLNRSGGTKADVEINTEVISISGKKIVLGMVQDISQRKEAERSLRISEERYRTLISEMINGFALHEIILDGGGRPIDYRFLEVNKSFEEMTGLCRKSIIGKTVLEVLPEIEPFWIETYGKVTLTGKPVRFEAYSKTFNKYFEVLAYNPTKKQFATVFTDITERITAKQEKEKLQAQLQRAQKMEVIGTLAGGVAHDLNNILSGIVSYPDLLLMDLPDDSPLKEPIATIKDSGLRAAKIVADLLTLARRGVAKFEVSNLNYIISDCLETPEYHKLKLLHPDVHIEADLKSDLLNILGSPVHLSKAFMNLVSNASEAMPEGGTIRISTENRYIDKPITGYDNVIEGDYIVLTISDTGIGLSAEDRERIFEPFYTRKKMGRSGTGLGMAVVWGTVKDHKGYIDIQSGEGVGTTFTLYFPITMSLLSKDDAAASIEELKGDGESILVVDDVPTQRKLASVMLSRLGYSVAAVSGGEEAVEYVKQKKVDLLLLDMIMDPGIDGLETYKAIKRMYPAQKAIIASGFSETDRVKETQSLGAGQYIIKPYTVEKIGKAVKEELKR